MADYAVLDSLPVAAVRAVNDPPVDPQTGPLGHRIEGVNALLTWLHEHGWRLLPPACGAVGCDRPADWAFADLFLCSFHGGEEPVEGWTRVGSDGSDR